MNTRFKMWMMKFFVIVNFFVLSYSHFVFGEEQRLSEVLLFNTETWLNIDRFNKIVADCQTLNFTNNIGNTPLISIIKTDYVFSTSSPHNKWSNSYRLKLVDLLLMHGASPNVVDNTGTTPLTSAVGQGDFDLAERLIDAGAEINVQANFKSPLRFAVIYGRDANIVRLLLEHGAFVNEVDFQDNTALHHAAIFDLTEIVKVLLEYGADPKLQNDDGKTALELSRKRSLFSKTTSLLSDFEKKGISR